MWSITRRCARYLVVMMGQPVKRASRERLDMAVPFAKHAKSLITGPGLVTAELEAIQPVLDIA